MTGKTSKDPNDPDFVPHLNMGYNQNENSPASSMAKYERNTRRKRRSDARESFEVSVEPVAKMASFAPESETLAMTTDNNSEAPSCNDSGWYYFLLK